MQLEKKREAVRRKENEKIESHLEMIYYDAGREHSWLYRMLCCPHFGKITSERVIYSRNKPKTWEWWCPNMCKWWCPNHRWCPTAQTVTGLFCACWNKEIQQMDYDLVMDVTVEQSFAQNCLNTGTGIIHCAANADVSIIKDMHKQLIEALNDATKDNIDLEAREEKLKYAIER